MGAAVQNAAYGQLRGALIMGVGHMQTSVAAAARRMWVATVDSTATSRGVRGEPGRPADWLDGYVDCLHTLAGWMVYVCSLRTLVGWLGTSVRVVAWVASSLAAVLAATCMTAGVAVGGIAARCMTM